MNRQEGHLLVAAIRVQSHQLGQSPTPAQLADFLELSETEVRLQLNHLADLGAVDIVESAFATHAEIRDYLKLEELSEESGPALSDDLKDFDRRKQAEAERMAQLFDSGESDRVRQEKIERMGDELDEFRRRKPVNPFGEDD